jgi:carbohydrate kinase (thermoresistant glucokinase family)
MRSVILIVAGVAGSGKTTVGALVAGQLRWRFADADTFHPEANVEKMRHGEPLTDEDRMPWLQAIAAWIDEIIAAGHSGVITCSALKRSYRDLLLGDSPAAVLMFLEVSREILLQRVSSRPEHFFPERLLDSQLAVLEPPSPRQEPNVHVITADGDAQETAAKIIATLWPYDDDIG